MKLIFAFVSASLFLLVDSFNTTGQDWGHANVRKGAHMFWWFYSTTAKVPSITERPLLIWLQGGPGASSTGFGNFAELGPLDVDLKPRNTTWVKDYNILFIDNPVGTGFSYVDSSSALTTTNKQIALDLVKCINLFYRKRPEFEKVPLYITSESYGGKMAIEFALELVAEHKSNGKQTNLKGVQLIDAWISPVETVLSWAPYLYYLGAVDAQGAEQINLKAGETANYVKLGRWNDATTGFINTEHKIMDVSKNVDFYNVLKPIKGYPRLSRDSNNLVLPGARFDDNKINAIMNGPVKKALGLKQTFSMQNGAVFFAQSGDFMKPVTSLVERALNETDLIIQVVSGQLDLIVDTPGTVQWVAGLHWTQSPKWPFVARNALVANGINEGYVKKLGKLALYWVNRSGHMVPADNTSAMRAILKDLTGI